MFRITLNRVRDHIVIREGTLILAALTGLCMKLTDPVVDKVFNPLLHE